MISAKSDTASTLSGAGVWLSLTANDSTTSGPLAVTGVDLTGALGSAVLNPAATNGVWYSPGSAFAYLSVGETATDTFFYVVTDKSGATARAQATVTITGVNAPPVARSDTAAADAQHAVNVNVLANDSDPNRHDVLAVAAVNLAGTKGSAATVAGSPGLVTYSAGHAFDYLSVGETATDSFGYTVSDGHGGTSSSTVTVTVTGVNIAPVANADAAATDAQHGVWVPLTGNDTDANRHDTLAVTGFSLTGTKGSASFSQGSVNGLFYAPGHAFDYLSVGETASDSFAYTVSDGHGGVSTGTATVTVSGVNLPPSANADRASADAQHTAWIALTANDTDPNRHDTLTVSAVNLAGTKGTVTLAPGGATGVSYAPGSAFAYLSVGETATDTFAYTVSDGHGGVSSATATVTVSGVDAPPVANADTASTDAQHGVWLSLTANDTDPNRHDTLAVTSLNLAGTRGSVSFTSGLTNGVWYAPGTAFKYLSAGETATDSFAYTVSDGHGGTSTATARVTVSGANIAPVANPNAAATDAQHSVFVALTSNDTDQNLHDVLAVSAANVVGTKGRVSFVPGTTSGLAYDPNHAFDYLSAGETASDTFGYTVSDGHGGTSTSTATVTVTGVNLAPSANADTASTDAQHGVWMSLTANDTDPNRHDTLAVTSLDQAGTKGSASFTPGVTNGIWYSPGSAFAYLSAGETATDRFAYTVSDGRGGVSTATATVTITGVNAPPAATPDTAATDAQHAVFVGLTGNDTDPNAHDVLAVTGIDQTGTKGTVTLDPASPAGVTYAPGHAFDYLSVGETATDRFAYTVSDGHGGTTSSYATVTVTGVNQAPVTTPFAATTDADHGLWLSLLGSTSDPNRHDVLSITSVSTDGTRGAVSFNPSVGSGVWYSPGQAFQNIPVGQSAPDTFSYTVSDGHGGTTTGTATVNVVGSGSLAVAGKAFYVATNGSDNWSGRLAQPNADGTDGPFATLGAAQRAMEADLSTQTTYVEGGDYYLNNPLVLTQRDSGQTWSAYDGNTPRIHGGTALTGWTNQGDGIWTVTPPAGSMAQGGAVDTLFVNGVAQIDARFPDASPGGAAGWLFTTPNLPGQDPTTTFQFAPGSIPQFSNPDGLYAVVFSQNGWSDVASPVDSIDYASGTITLANPSQYPIGAGSRFYLYNAAGQVTTPGEYYYDPASNLLTYKAPAGFDGTGAMVGTGNRVVGIYGAKNVTLSGLSIGDAQSGGSAVQISSSQNVTVEDSLIANTGNGILVDGGSSGITLSDNEIANLNGTGILITAGSNGITVDGNYIHDVGALTSGSGIWFTGSSNDVFSNNVIENVAKIGIGGGSLAGASDASYNNLITHNTIVNANQQTSDAGGIYISGRQQDSTGDVISFNTVSNTASAVSSDLGNPKAGIGAGIYLDDFASGVSVHDNLLQGNVDGVWVHLGSNNTIDDNVVTGSTVALAMHGINNTGFVALQPPSGNVFANNTAYLDQPGSIATLISDVLSAAQWSGNVYGGPALSARPFSIDLQGNTTANSFSQWQALGFDTSSAVPSSGLTLGQALVRLSGGV